MCSPDISRSMFPTDERWKLLSTSTVISKLKLEWHFSYLQIFFTNLHQPTVAAVATHREQPMFWAGRFVLIHWVRTCFTISCGLAVSRLDPNFHWLFDSCSSSRKLQSTDHPLPFWKIPWLFWCYHVFHQCTIATTISHKNKFTTTKISNMPYTTLTLGLLTLHPVSKSELYSLALKSFFVPVCKKSLGISLQS